MHKMTSCSFRLCWNFSEQMLQDTKKKKIWQGADVAIESRGKGWSDVSPSQGKSTTGKKASRIRRHAQRSSSFSEIVKEKNTNILTYDIWPSELYENTFLWCMLSSLQWSTNTECIHKHLENNKPITDAKTMWRVFSKTRISQ